MIFDDPAYADVSTEIIQKALAAEGLPVLLGDTPVYRFVLFNVPPEAYRIDYPCTVVEQVSSRVLWMMHPYLGLAEAQFEKVADDIEKVMTHANELTAYG